MRYDGSTWEQVPFEQPAVSLVDGSTRMGPDNTSVGPDGTVWIVELFQRQSPREGMAFVTFVVRAWDGDVWTTYGPVEVELDVTQLIAALNVAYRLSDGAHVLDDGTVWFLDGQLVLDADGLRSQELPGGDDWCSGPTVMPGASLRTPSTSSPPRPWQLPSSWWRHGSRQQARPARGGPRRHHHHGSRPAPRSCHRDRQPAPPRRQRSTRAPCRARWRTWRPSVHTRCAWRLRRERQRSPQTIVWRRRPSSETPQPGQTRPADRRPTAVRWASHQTRGRPGPGRASSSTPHARQ